MLVLSISTTKNKSVFQKGFCFRKNKDNKSPITVVSMQPVLNENRISKTKSKTKTIKIIIIKILFRM